jgi:transposase
LALVTVLQFAENLPDRQAAEAVRSRIDWKYLLGLELTDSGFDASVLCEFRARLVAGAAEQRLLDHLLTLARERGLLKARGRQRTDSTHVLAAIHVLNRLECVGETLRHALNSLAVVAPEWLREQVPIDWYERYGSRVDNYRLPKADAERAAPMGRGCCRWSGPRPPRSGCARSRPSRSCAGSGYNNTTPPTRRAACAGERRAICPPGPC